MIDTARARAAKTLVVVYGHGGEVVRTTLDAPIWHGSMQEPQLGTGHAVQQALPHLDGDGTTLVLYGDVPLIQADTLKRLLHAAQDALAILTVELADPAATVASCATQRASRAHRRAEGRDSRRASHS